MHSLRVFKPTFHLVQLVARRVAAHRADHQRHRIVRVLSAPLIARLDGHPDAEPVRTPATTSALDNVIEMTVNHSSMSTTVPVTTVPAPTVGALIVL